VYKDHITKVNFGNACVYCDFQPFVFEQLNDVILNLPISRPTYTDRLHKTRVVEKKTVKLFSQAFNVLGIVDQLLCKCNAAF